MYNWSTNEKTLKEHDKEKHNVWKLEQLINFGLGGSKIKRRELVKYLPKLNLDRFRRKFIESILNVK